MAYSAIVITQDGVSGAAKASRNDLDLYSVASKAIELSNSTDGNVGVRTWEWVLVERPPGSTATLASGTLVDTSSSTEIEADLYGRYVVSLRVNGLANNSSGYSETVCACPWDALFTDGSGNPIGDWNPPAAYEGWTANWSGNTKGAQPDLYKIIQELREYWLAIIGGSVFFTSWFADLNDCISAVSSGDTIIVDNATSLTSGVTLPADVTCFVMEAGIIDLDDYNLGISSHFNCNRHKCFDYTGTGVATFAQEAIDEVYPEWFGAAADATTDCQPGIYAALTSIATVGGIVSFTQGTYGFHTDIEITNLSNITFKGEGISATKLKLLDTYDDNGFNISNSDNITVRDLTINMNKAAAGASGLKYGIYIVTDDTGGCNSIILDSVYVHDCSFYSIGIVGSTGGGAVSRPITVTLRDCIVDSSDDSAVYVDGGVNNTSPPSIYMYDCNTSDNESHGIEILRTTGCIISNCISNNATNGNGIQISFSDDFKIKGNECNSNHTTGAIGYGISVTEGSTDFVVANNTCIGNDTSNIMIDASSGGDPAFTVHDTWATVVNNICNDAGSASNIEITHAGHISVLGNVCDNAGASGIEVTSSNCYISGNVCTNNTTYGIDLNQEGGSSPGVGYSGCVLEGNVFDSNGSAPFTNDHTGNTLVEDETRIIRTSAYLYPSDGIDALSSGDTYLIDSDITLNATKTIASGIHVKAIPGNIIDLDAYDLTINGTFEAERAQCFDYTGVGVVTFGNSSVEEVYPEWFGIDGADDDLEVQYAVDSITTGIVKLAADTTYSFGTAVIVDKSGIELNGTSMESTIIETDGGYASGTVIDFDKSGGGSIYGCLRNLTIDCDNASPSGVIIGFDEPYNHCIVENIRVINFSANNALFIGNGSDIEVRNFVSSNNEASAVEHIYVDTLTNATFDNIWLSGDNGAGGANTGYAFIFDTMTNSRVSNLYFEDFTTSSLIDACTDCQFDTIKGRPNTGLADIITVQDSCSKLSFRNIDLDDSSSDYLELDSVTESIVDLASSSCNLKLNASATDNTILVNTNHVAANIVDAGTDNVVHGGYSTVQHLFYQTGVTAGGGATAMLANPYQASFRAMKNGYVRSIIVNMAGTPITAGSMTVDFRFAAVLQTSVVVTSATNGGSWNQADYKIFEYPFNQGDAITCFATSAGGTLPSPAAVSTVLYVVTVA